MGKQETEMLKGTLEGIVLALLSGPPAYGYEITAWLREQGFTDIAEGTVYALLVRVEQRGLVDVEKVPSEKGRRARSTPSTPGVGRTSTSSGGRGASSRNASNSSAKESADMVAKWIEALTGSLEQKKQYKRDKARIEALPSRTAAPGRRSSATSCTTEASRTATPSSRCWATSPTCGSEPPSTGRPSGDRRRGPGGVRRDLRPGLRRHAVDRQGARR